jgi:glycosyltransferase involved in cell wall biosynthesis
VKLVVAMPVRNELGRYLELALHSALTFADAVCVLDDGSTDGGFEWMRDDLATTEDRFMLRRFDGPAWDEREGDESLTRQALLDLALDAEPTHILALDADELVSEALELRRLIGKYPDQAVWALRIVEVWERDPCRMRVDGLWRPRWAPICWKVPPPDRRGDPEWQIENKRCACPRHPPAVKAIERQGGARRAKRVDVMHLGWMDPTTRERRASRYDLVDGGDFHNADHLASILDTQRLRTRPYAPAVAL